MSFLQSFLSIKRYIKEPDSGLPLKCDMCEVEPPLYEPMCVQVSQHDALTYEERNEDEGEGEAERRDLEEGDLILNRQIWIRDDMG
jgi:benzoyl-CoA reductase subunit BamC